MATKRRRGFSLMETLVAFAVMSLLMTTVVVIITTIFKNTRKANAIGLVNTEGMLALQTIDNMVRYARSMDCQANQLNIVNLNGENIRFFLDNSTHQVASRSVDMATDYYLTSTETVASLCNGISNICSPNGTGKTVNVCFALESAEAVATDMSTTAGIEFKTQITLRNWGL